MTAQPVPGMAGHDISHAQCHSRPEAQHGAQTPAPPARASTPFFNPPPTWNRSADSGVRRAMISGWSCALTPCAISSFSSAWGRRGWRKNDDCRALYATPLAAVPSRPHATGTRAPRQQHMQPSLRGAACTRAQSERTHDSSNTRSHAAHHHTTTCRPAPVISSDTSCMNSTRPSGMSTTPKFLPSSARCATMSATCAPGTCRQRHGW